MTQRCQAGGRLPARRIETKAGSKFKEDQSLRATDHTQEELALSQTTKMAQRSHS